MKLVFDSLILASIFFCILVVAETFLGISLFSGNFFAGLFFLGISVFWCLANSRS